MCLPYKQSSQFTPSTSVVVVLVYIGIAAGRGVDAVFHLPRQVLILRLNFKQILQKGFLKPRIFQENFIFCLESKTTQKFDVISVFFCF